MRGPAEPTLPGAGRGLGDVRNNSRSQDFTRAVLKHPPNGVCALDYWSGRWPGGPARDYGDPQEELPHGWTVADGPPARCEKGAGGVAGPLRSPTLPRKPGGTAIRDLGASARTAVRHHARSRPALRGRGGALGSGFAAEPGRGAITPIITRVAPCAEIPTSDLRADPGVGTGRPPIAGPAGQRRR